MRKSSALGFTAAILSTTVLTPAAFAEQEASLAIEEIAVVAKTVTYANTQVTKAMMDQQSPASSILSVLDNMPGVNIGEGDVFGSDDWSTSVSMRGFSLNLDEQTIGITVDGLPNGNSNYGGGSKANRFLDPENTLTVDVAQGTADIASPSNEALGGTLNFVSDDPLDEARARGAVTYGQHNAHKIYVRYDTGEIAPETFAYFSYSNQRNDRWIGDGGGWSNRDHAELKVKSRIADVNLTGRISFDNSHEDNYNGISLGQFAITPDWDLLTTQWTGVPYKDQQFVEGWSTLRTNWLAYVKADFDIGPTNVAITPYYHRNKGRGDWIPPYLVSLINDGTTNAGSRDLHVGPNTIFGGTQTGIYQYVDASGNPLTPIAGCTAALGDFDPACYAAGAQPVMSYRHTHYWKERKGITLDTNTTIESTGTDIRIGLWWEDYQRKEHRDWHEVIDASVSMDFNEQAYWRQYDREFPVDTLMLYGEVTQRFGDFTIRGGLKKFYVDLERVDNFMGGAVTGELDSDSDLLLSGGIVYEPIMGLELFAGYSENFAAIKDGVLEVDASALDVIEPETAENIDVGIRYSDDMFSVSLAYYDIKFDNRITFLAPGTSGTDIDYLIGTNGTYVNVGGIKSDGFEFGGSVRFMDNWSLYLSYTNNNSEYVGDSAATGIPAGNKVAGAPEDMYVVSVDYDNEGMRAGVSMKHVGSRFGDFANADLLPGYTVFDAYIGYSGDLDGHAYDFSVNANNFTDERYLGGGVEGSYFLGGGQTITATLRVDF